MGLEITYLSETQLPKSSSLQRSLQKGMYGSPKATSFLQIGHFIRAGSRVAARALSREF